MTPQAGRTLLIALAASALCGARGGSDDALPHVPAGFTVGIVAHIDDARELAAAPNGDLFVGTSGNAVDIVPGADATPGRPEVFARFSDGVAAGVALSPNALYVGTHGGVWRIAYAPGDRSARSAPERLATVRPAGGGGHSTTSVAVASDVLFASVGSSCNACTESDPTRATILELPASGGPAHPRAEHIRNAIALAVDPRTDALWAGVAGRDDLAPGHPYEIFDDVSAQARPADYGWPDCYEDRRSASARDCTNAAVPRVVFPAYATPIGAAFYEADRHGAEAFPPEYRGGVFVALHGSWHQPPVAPRVVFVPLHGDEPLRAVDWHDPDAQWKPFLTGFQRDDGSRTGRPTGVAVGPDGSLFVADDLAGVVYRIRPQRSSVSVSSRGG